MGDRSGGDYRGQEFMFMEMMGSGHKMMMGGSTGSTPRRWRGRTGSWRPQRSSNSTEWPDTAAGNRTLRWIRFFRLCIKSVIFFARTVCRVLPVWGGSGLFQQCRGQLSTTATCYINGKLHQEELLEQGRERRGGAGGLPHLSHVSQGPHGR